MNKTIRIKQFFTAAIMLLSFAAIGQPRKYITTRQGDNIYMDALPYKGNTRTIQNRLAEELYAEDNRDSDDNDDSVVNKGIRAMQAANKPLHFGSRTYRTGTITIPEGYCKFIGNKNTIFQRKEDPYGYIQSAQVVDRSLPTATHLGPFSGACFYFPFATQDILFKDIHIFSYRYGFAFLATQNTPVLDGIDFQYVNAAVVAYQGMQNLQMLNCGGVVNTICIGNATCFPAFDVDGVTPNPYKNGDNYFFDQFTLKNVTSYTTWGIKTNKFFDDFFRKSIFRPDEPNYTATTQGTLYPQYGTLSNGAINQQVTVARSPSGQYQNHDYWNPSGWAIWVPARTDRRAFSMDIGDIDFRGPFGGNDLERGIAFVNTGIDALIVHGHVSAENAYPVRNGYFTFGSTWNSNRIDVPFTLEFNGCSLFTFTNRGNGGTWDKLQSTFPWLTGERYLDEKIRASKNWLAGRIGEVGTGFTLQIIDMPGFSFQNSFLKSRMSQILTKFTIHIGNSIGKSIPLENVPWHYRQDASNKSLIRFDGGQDIGMYDGAPVVITFDDSAL